MKARGKEVTYPLVNAYHVTYGLDVTETRSTNNYGPNQHPEKLIPRMITNALRGKPLPIYGCLCCQKSSIESASKSVESQAYGTDSNPYWLKC